MPLRVKLGLLILIALGVGAFVVASIAGGSGDACHRPAAIQQLVPECNTQVQHQQTVGVDMQGGYGVELSINGTPIPLDELAPLPGGISANRGVAQDTFAFTPGAGKVLTELRAQQNCATVTYWKLIDGPERSNTFTWCFRAS